MTEPLQSATRKNLVQRCAGVMAAVEHVPKRGHNSFHNYDYATEADIADAVRSEMARQELLLIPSVVKAEFREAQTKSGTERAVTLTVRYKLTDGVESEVFEVLGEGQDRGDKATYKAMTGATKYALLKLFLISTGDDPEADDGEKPPPAKGRSAPVATDPAPIPPTKPSERPAHVDRAWATAIRLYGDKPNATEPWNIAVTSVIGPTRKSASLTADEAADVVSILTAKATAPADIPF